MALHRFNPFFQRLLKGILYIWSSIVLSLVLSILATWLTTNSFSLKGTPLAWINQHLSVVLFAVGILLFLTISIGLLGYTRLIATRMQNIIDHVSSYRKQYYRYLIYRHRDFDVKGLSVQGTYALELEQVFVEIIVDPKPVHLISQDPLQDSEVLKEGGNPIWYYLSSTTLSNQHFVILGAPGSGKTTLLKHLTLTLAFHQRKFRGQFGGIQKLPILLFLRDHIDALKNNSNFSILDAIEDHHRTWEQRMPPAGWMRRQLMKGRCLIMFDGLDEVANTEDRQKVVDWVQRQMVAYGMNRFIITSRPFGYHSNPLSGVTVLEVRPFTPKKVEEFIHNWYIANEIKSMQMDDPGVHMKAKADAKDLLWRLHKTPDLFSLAVNPLLLTMITTVHRYHSSLPERRVKLYAEICDVFLGKRQQARGIPLELTPAQMQHVLQPLAFHMMLEGTRKTTSAEAKIVIAGPLAKVSSQMSPEIFLQLVENTSGLFLEREHGIYSFAHSTFQEFLAAVHIKEEHLEHVLVKQVGNSWWHETIRLYSAQGDATPIIAACLTNNHPSVPSLTLAIACQEEAFELQPAVRTQLDILLKQGVEETDSELRLIVSEALLNRRLRQMARLNEETYVDTSLITCAEYQRFLDDRLLSEEYRQPDHWKEMQFAPGQGREPVLGVRPSDATAFCKWLTEREFSVWSYRLPRNGEFEKEIKDSGLTDKLMMTGIGYWTDDGESFSWIRKDPLASNVTIQERIDNLISSDLERGYNLLQDLAGTSNLMRVFNQARNISKSIYEANLLVENQANNFFYETELSSTNAITHLNATIHSIDDDLHQAYTCAKILSGTYSSAFKQTYSYSNVIAIDKVVRIDIAKSLEFAHTNALNLARTCLQHLKRAHNRIHDLVNAVNDTRSFAETLAHYRESYNRSDLTLDVANNESILHVSTFITNLENTISDAINMASDFSHEIENIKFIDVTLFDALNHVTSRIPKLSFDKAASLEFYRWYIRFYALVFTAHLYYWLQQESTSHSLEEQFHHLLHGRKLDKDEIQRTRDGYLNLYITLALLEERIQGRFPASEGILIIKERREEKLSNGE